MLCHFLQGVRLGKLTITTGSNPRLELLGDAIVSNPTYLCASDGQTLFHVSEGSDVASTAAGCLQINKERSFLQSTGKTRLTKGIDACYIACSPCKNYIAVANYTSGDVATFETHGGTAVGEMVGFLRLPEAGSMVVKERQVVDGVNGLRSSLNSLSNLIVAEIQEHSHAHCCVFHPSGKWLYVCDLGSDSLYKLSFHKGHLLFLCIPDILPQKKHVFGRRRFHIQNMSFCMVPVGVISAAARLAFPAGSGPRHCRFHPQDSRLMLVVNELDCSVQVG